MTDREAMMDRPAREVRPMHIAIGAVLAVLVAVALVAGVGRMAGYADIARTIDDAHLPWLAVCAVGQLIVFGGYTGALREAVAVDGGPWVPTRLVLRLVLASFAATQLFAFGGVGGLAMVYWAFRRVGLPRSEAVVRLIGFTTAIYLVFAAIAWTAALAALLSDSSPLGMSVPWLLGLPVVLVVASWFTAPSRVARWTAPSDRVLRRGLATGVGAAAWVRGALGSRDGRRVLAWGTLYWLGNLLSLWAALRAVGASPHLSAVVLAFTTGYLAQSLPIPLIATGGVDAATTFLLHAVGVPLETALVGVVTHRLFAFWLPVIPGSFFALTLSRTGRAMGAVAEHGDDARAPRPIVS